IGTAGFCAIQPAAKSAMTANMISPPATAKNVFTTSSSFGIWPQSFSMTSSFENRLSAPATVGVVGSGPAFLRPQICGPVISNWLGALGTILFDGDQTQPH